MELGNPHPEAVRERLRKLWAQTEPKLSSAAIGREMNMTKNMIIGLARRMKLDKRPSPIPTRTYPEKKSEPPPKRVAQVSLPPLASSDPIIVPVVPSSPMVAKRPVFVAPPPRPAPAKPYGRVTTCCFPIGEPGKPGFRFCGDLTEPGAVYCGAHCLIAYVPLRRREVADAAD